MATVKGKSEGKSMFLKEFFVDHPDARKDEIDKAWQEAGNEGTISDSLIYKLLSKLKLTGKRRTKAKASLSVGAGKRLSGTPQFQTRGNDTKAAVRTVANADGRKALKPAKTPAGPRSISRAQTLVLIRLESQIDDLLHDAKTAGGLSEFEKALCTARRILIRSHGD
jgi:hypothetical protein